MTFTVRLYNCQEFQEISLMMAKLMQNSLLNAKTRYQLLATVIGKSFGDIFLLILYYICTYAVNIITFGHGVGVGWLSPTLTKIQGPETPLDFQVNIDEISWLGSMLGLGSLCGNLTVAILLERMGRKFCIYLLAGPYAVSTNNKIIVNNLYKVFQYYSVCGS